MDVALTLDNNMTLDNSNTSLMKKTKERKSLVMKELKSKVEQAKLNLIYTELEENNIKCDRNYTSLKQLRKDLKKK